MFQWDIVQQRPDGKILLLWRHERIFEEGLFKKGSKVLDVGGWGHLSERIIQEGGTCIILDKFTEDQYYPDRVRSLPHIVADICTDTVVRDLSNSFDIVCCFETLEHVSDAKTAIKNMYELICKNGWIVGTMPIPGGTHPADDPHVTFLDENTMRIYLEEAGFKNILVEPTPSINKTDVFCPSMYFKGQK